MTPEELEGIIDGTPDPDRRATAYAALTLTRLLAPEWTHRTTVKEKGKPDRQVEIVKAAGQTVGDREGLQKRLVDLLAQLSRAREGYPFGMMPRR